MPPGAEPIIKPDLINLEESTIYDFGAERAFIACLIRQPNLIVEAQSRVPTTAIFGVTHRYIYEIMKYIFVQSTQRGFALAFDHISMLSVARNIGGGCEEKFLQKTNGMERVREIEAFAPQVDLTRFPAFIHTVLDRAARVTAYRQARLIQNRVMDLQANPEAQPVMADAEMAFSEAARSLGNMDDNNLSLLASDIRATMDKARLQYLYPNERLFHIYCDQFPTWMQISGGGFRRKGLTMLCARPKVGKSSLLLNILSQAAMHPTNPIPCLFVDTEMSREEMSTREIASLSGWKEQDIIAGRMFAEGCDASSVEQAVLAMQNSQLYYINVAGRPVTHIMSILRNFRNQHVGTYNLTLPGLNGAPDKEFTFSRQALVVYDWLKLPDSNLIKGGTSEHQALGYQCSLIKDAAARLDLAVVAGCQGNRESLYATEEEWQTAGEAFVAGTDRFSQFCTQLAILRNTSRLESQAIMQQWPDAHPEEHGANAQKFNQMLHIMLNRHGPDFRQGIPLYHDKGRFRYTEFGFASHSGETDGVTAFMERLPELIKAIKRGTVGQMPVRINNQGATNA